MGFKWTAVGRYKARGDFMYGDLKGDSAVIGFFGSPVYRRVFRDITRIRTLYQGIQALKRFTKAEESEW